MSNLTRRLADLEHQNPVRFVVPEIGASIDSIDAAQALWIALMVPDESEWRSAAIRKLNEKEFVEFSLNGAALGSFVESLSKEALDALMDDLSEGLEEEATES